MSEVEVQKVTSQKRESVPALREMDAVMEAIRRRAFELFSGRGFGDGMALDDWLRAERDICWPAAELRESDSICQLNVALPGFAGDEVSVTAGTDEVVIHAKAAKSLPVPRSTDPAVRWSEFRSNDVYRRIVLPHAIDPATAKASLGNGMLQVTANRAGAATRNVPVSAAA